jgi:hypothetical protein
MGLPAGPVGLFHVNEIKFDEKVHCGQDHLAASRVKSVEDPSQMAHGPLFGGQGIDKSTARHEVPGSKLDEVALGIGQVNRNVGGRTKDVGPMHGRGGYENLQEQWMSLGQRYELLEWVAAQCISGHQVFTDPISNYLEYALARVLVKRRMAQI